MQKVYNLYYKMKYNKTPALSKEFLGFILKCVRDMARTYSQLMKVVQCLKKAFKAAIRSGKIFYVGAIGEIYASDKIPAIYLALNRGSCFRKW